MRTLLRRIQIKGFRSIRDAEIEMRPINVLIGTNGSGKSNLVMFLRMLRACGEGAFQEFVSRHGGASVLLHHGPKVTKEIETALFVDTHDGAARYSLALEFAADDRLAVRNESLEAGSRDGGQFLNSISGPQGKEPHLRMFPTGGEHAQASEEQARFFLTRFGAFHFHDTSIDGPLRRRASTEDTFRLQPDGGNLPAFLWRLRTEKEDAFLRISRTLEQILPWFRELVLVPEDRSILLRCRVAGRADSPISVSQMSDGTLRLIALLTVLNLPGDRQPSLTVIDEPELGLHPAAEGAVARMIRSSAEQGAQFVIATQSATFLSHFDPEDIVVVENDEGASTFQRHTREELAGWLERYSLGQIWMKNLIGGRP